MSIPEKGFIRPLEPMRLQMLRRECGEMTFDEVVALAQQADQFLEHMSVFDIAWKKFKQDRRIWWEYAWLISCEADTFCPSDPHVEYRGFLVAYPRNQSVTCPADFEDWLHQHEGDVCEEFYTWLPVYLRPDEIVGYASKIYHKQRGIDGHLRDFEIMEVSVES